MFQRLKRQKGFLTLEELSMLLLFEITGRSILSCNWHAQRMWALRLPTYLLSK